MTIFVSSFYGMNNKLTGWTKKDKTQESGERIISEKMKP